MSHFCIKLNHYGVNHAVVIVGYNDIEDYWIVRNSWGQDWNEDGYFNVGYRECAIENYIYYASLAKNLSYCPASTNSADYEWIKRVELNGEEKSSGKSTYSNFTDEVLTTLKRGDTYTLYVDGHTTSSYLEFVKVWIDFNGNKDFIDLGEEIDLGNYTFEGDHTFSANFKIPGDAVLSDTRMRVYLKYAGEPDPCENASYGEVEDYTVKIISPATLADNYSDYGIDTDGDGYYNYLAIDVGVNVTESGYYRTSGSLYDELGNYVDYESNYTYFDSGNHLVALKFGGIEIRANGVSGTFDLKRLYLEDEDYTEVDYRYDAYTTSYYNYTDFEPLPARFASGFYDYGEDTDGDLLYDYLVIEKVVNISEAGNYEVYGSLYSPGGDYVDSDSNYTTLSTGLHNVTLRFQGWDIYKTEENGNFDVNTYLYCYPPESTATAKATAHPKKITVDSPHIPVQKDSGGKEIGFDNYRERRENKTLEVKELGSTWLDLMENMTAYYSYTEFEPPPAEFNDQYSDSGEDTDGDGLYDYLVVDVGVNVIEAGDYKVSGYLYETGTYDSVDSTYNITYLSEGSQTVQLKFEGINIRQNEYNGTYDLKSLYLYNYSSPVPTPTPPPISVFGSQSESKSTEARNISVGYGEQLDYRYYAYTTSYFNYTEFQIPPAEFTGSFNDYGEDIDGDGLYDYLVIEAEINVTKSGEFEFWDDLYYYNETTGYWEYGVDCDWHNYSHLDLGVHNLTIKLSGIEICNLRYNGTFKIKLYLHGEVRGEWLQIDDDEYYTQSYNYTDFQIPPAEFNDVYVDYGEDTDGDGLYDYLVVDVGVNVTEAGDYKVSGYLYETGTYDSVDYDSNTTYLNEGSQTVQLKFEGINIRQNEYNGTYDLKSLYLYNYSSPVPPPPTPTPAPTVTPIPTVTPTPPPISVFGSQHEDKSTEAGNISVGYGEQLDYRYYAYTTYYYNYTEFQISPAEFNDVFSDYGEDTDGDGLYDYLVIDVGVNVIEAGDYEIGGELYENGTYNYVDYDCNTTYLNEGNQTVQLRFEGIKIRQNEYNGTYDLKYLYLYNYSYPVPPPVPTPTPAPTATPIVTPTPTPISVLVSQRESKPTGAENVSVGYGEQLDYRYYAYTTSYYSYTEFQIPPAEFNDVYSDYGGDTDGDGLYDYLVVNVSVNVREAGDYEVSGYLYENGTYDSVDSAYNTTYLNEGSQTVQLRFEGIKIRQNGYNGTYDLKSLYLYNYSYPVPLPVPTPTPAPTVTPIVTPIPPPISALFSQPESKSTEARNVSVGYGEQLDYRYYAYTTTYYNYTEFEESIPDAYEPDDNPSLANYISVDGTKQNHNFHVPSDQDWLKFNATEGNSYTIETSELGTESDTYLYLYDSDGTTEIDHDDDSGIGLASKIIWNCRISGIYYVMAQHYSYSAFGPETRYNVSVTVKEAPPNGPYNNIYFDEIASVLIGQDLNFVGTDWSCIPVLIFGDPDDDEIAGDIYIADSYNHFDSSMMAMPGKYYVNLNRTNKTKSDAILLVGYPVMYLDLKVGNDSVLSIIRGTPLRIDFTTNLDANDLVDLRVRDPDGILLEVNPADPTQNFDDIKVSKLWEYGSMNESKQINTTGWDIGIYEFYVRTEAEHAQGLDVCSATSTLMVLEKATPTVSISTDKKEYHPGDIMNISIRLQNPTETAQQLIFKWYLILPDSGDWKEIMFTEITLPQGFDEFFSMPLLIKYWAPVEFNATWHVVLLDKTTYEIISEDAADWKYVPTKEIAQGEVMPEVEEIAREITKNVEKLEMPMFLL